MSVLSDPKHEAFARAVAAGRSKRDAAIEAGYAASDASSRGSKLSARPEIKERIAELSGEVQQAICEKLAITVERVLEEYGKLAFLDIRRAFDQDGKLLPIQEMPADLAAAIAGLEAEELFEGRGDSREKIGRLHKIRLSDKKGALDSLAKHLGMFKPDKVALTDPDGRSATLQVVIRSVLDPQIESSPR